MEGVLSSSDSYSPDEIKIKSFLSELTNYCKKKNIELFLVSGHHEVVASKKLSEKEFERYFDDKHFLRVNEEYIASKNEADQKLHRDGLSSDPCFVDTYFKQVAIQKVLNDKKVSVGDALLLGNDLWVDGYYTTRFSRIDFALFENNLLDRGKPAKRVSGLAYFNFDIESVIQLLKEFPKTDTSLLDKYVFDSMRKILVGDNFVDSIKKGFAKKIQNK